MATLDEYAYDPFTYADDLEAQGMGWMEAFHKEMEAVENMAQESLAKPDEDIVGHVMHWQRGDGYAYYVVTKEKPLTLAWLAVGDRWVVEEALIRGLRKKDIIEDRKRARRLRELFGKSKNKMRTE